MATRRLLLNNIVIRQAQQQDAQRVAEIRQNTWRTTYSGLIPEYYFENFNLEKETERYKNLFVNADNAFVIEVNNKVVGFFFLSNTPQIISEQEYSASIGAIYVEQDFQRMGLGKKAFEVINNYFKNKKQKHFFVYCLKTNEIGKSFYEKNGGRIIGEKQFKDLLEVCFLFDVK